MAYAVTYHSFFFFIDTIKIGMCLEENYSVSPSNEYSRHYSAEYLRRENMNSKLGEAQKKKKKVITSVEVLISTLIRIKSKKGQNDNGLILGRVRVMPYYSAESSD